MSLINRPNLIPLLLLGVLFPAHARDLCADLKLIQNAKPGFADLRGQPGNDDSWHTTPSGLGDLGECRISQTDTAAHLTCTSAFIKDEQLANARRAEIMRAMSACLGPGWTTRDNSLGDALRGTGFTSDKPDAPVAFSVALYRQPSTPPEFSLWFTATMSLGNKEKPAARKAPSGPPVLDWRAAGNTLCKDLGAVVAGVTDKFESLKGRKHDRYWLTKSAIDGLAECRIYSDANLTYYTCEAVDDADADSAAQVFSALSSDVQACLPKPWQVLKRQRKDGMPVVEFTHPVTPATVIVRMRELLGEYSVVLDVDVESD